jgi:hypothetical protein
MALSAERRSTDESVPVGAARIVFDSWSMWKKLDCNDVDEVVILAASDIFPPCSIFGVVS